MERCSEHVVADGEVDRSKKMDGVVERTRRCKECGRLFKTYEMTGDQIDRQNAEHNMEIRDLKRELDFYKELAGLMNQVYDLEEEVKNSLRMEYGQ